LPPLLLLIVATHFINQAQGNGGWTIEVGEKAPKVTGLTWIRGSPVELFPTKEGNGCVLIFATSWFKTDSVLEKHLGQLEKEFPQFIFITISNEPEEALRKFLSLNEGWGSSRVATDSLDRISSEFGLGGILLAAVILDSFGTTLWYGYPDKESLATLLGRVTKKTFDLKTSAADSLLYRFAFEASDLQTPEPELKKLQDRILEIEFQLPTFRAESFRVIYETLRGRRSSFLCETYRRLYLKNGADEELEKIEKEIRNLSTKDSNPDSFFTAIRSEGLIKRYLLEASKEPLSMVNLSRMADDLKRELASDPYTLSSAATAILTTSGLKIRDLNLAAELARRACEESKLREQNDLSDAKFHMARTYAEILFLQGNKSEAIFWQTKATAIAPTEGQKKAAEEKLLEYRK